MSFRKQAPGETGPKGVVTWCALKLEPGSHEEFFTLAPTQWFWSHWRGRSVPCYAEFTGGQADCPFCKTRDYWQGYVPVCNEVGQRFLALVKETNKDVTDKLQTGQAVMVARKKGKGEPYTIRPAMSRKVRVPTQADEHAVTGIEAALVILWRDEFFKTWFAKNGDPQAAFKLALHAANASRKAADDNQRELVSRVKDVIKVREQTAREEPVTLADALPHLNGVLKGRKA